MLKQTKKQTRAHFKNELQQMFLDSALAQANLKNLNSRLAMFLKEHHGIWAGFLPLPHEVDATVAMLHSTHIQWVFPRVKDEELHFFKAPVASFGLADGVFEKNKWGIFEPNPSHAQVGEVGVGEIQGFLVPALAYDYAGTRLGRGKGFYDRLLKRSQAPRVGLAFEVQISQKQLPAEVHDEGVDWVITDAQTYEAKK